MRKLLEKRFPDMGYTEALGEVTVTVPAAQIAEVAEFVKTNPKLLFQQVMDICGVDYPGRSLRFEVVYHFLSLRFNKRLRVAVATDADTPVPSLVPIFPCAGWWEREAFDMFGITFEGNPDLRRILTDYGFEGHPMRKDFPLTGYVEVRYDEEKGEVVKEPVRLTQAYRHFDFESPWEGAQHLFDAPPKSEQGTA